MASYRDRQYPELLRFPGAMRPKILIALGWFINLIAAALSFTFSVDVRKTAAEAGALALLSLWFWTCWPGEIVCGPDEIESFNLFGRKRRRIGWGEVAAIEEGDEFRGVARRLGLRTGVLRIRPARGGGMIVHTPRHPDRERLVRECGLRIKEFKEKEAALADAPSSLL